MGPAGTKGLIDADVDRFYTPCRGSISPATPIRGGFNEVLNRRLSCGAARPPLDAAEEALCGENKALYRSPRQITESFSQSMLISQLMEPNRRQREGKSIGEVLYG